jgi:formate/nitrite transporter FocA (FNT family)
MILATVFPITACVACGFEHSVANMYFLLIGVALAGESRYRAHSLTQSAFSRW